MATQTAIERPGRFAAPATASPALRICMLAACPFPANHGTPGSIREMAEALALLGHDVHVVTYHAGEDIPLRGVHLHRIPPLTRESAVVVGPTIRRPLYDLQMVAKTLQVIRRHRPDILHAHGYEAALVAAVCRVVSSQPVVYSAHNTMADELPSYGFIRPQWLARGAARLLDCVVPRLADRCLPHSANVERFLERQGLADRTHAIVNFGIDVDWMGGGDGARVRGMYGLHSAPVVLYAGVLDRFQRLDLLLEAIAIVAERWTSVKLLVVTTVPQPQHLERLLTEAERLRVLDHLVITRPQPLEAVRDFLQAADIAVVPRPQAAGFPIKLLNYMAARRPCVLFASSASAGVVHGDNAMLAFEDTPQALADALLELLRDGRLRDGIAHRGYEFVRRHHHRPAIAEQVCQCYEQVLHRQSGRDACHAFSS